VLNRSLLNKGCVPVNDLKALASIVSMCNLNVITPSYFTLFASGISRPFNVRRESGGLIR
jgi:hypothetical protein